MCDRFRRGELWMVFVTRAVRSRPGLTTNRTYSTPNWQSRLQSFVNEQKPWMKGPLSEPTSVVYFRHIVLRGKRVWQPNLGPAFRPELFACKYRRGRLRETCLRTGRLRPQPPLSPPVLHLAEEPVVTRPLLVDSHVSQGAVASRGGLSLHPLPRGPSSGAER